MKKIMCCLFVTSTLFLSDGQTFAYEVETHKKLSEAAVNASVLKTDPQTLSDLGLKPLDDPTQEPLRFPDSEGVLKEIPLLIQNGAALEDNLRGSRFLQHFFDPTNNSPFTDINLFELDITIEFYGLPFLPLQNSPDWALEDGNTFGGPLGQNFSFRDARQYFFNALTMPTKQERDQNFGLTFQTLGHVIHHVQDMAQPQHVRNEQHPPIFSSGLYEIYTNDEKILKDLPISGYAPVFSRGGYETTFNTARKFWDTDSAMGLAEFTNENFVSYNRNFRLAPNADTNTLRIEDILPHLDYPKPNVQETGGQIFSEPVTLPADVEVLVLGGPQSLTGKIIYVGTPVTDSFRPEASDFNNRTSTFSIFDGDLRELNITVPCFPGVSGDDPCVTRAVFSVNQKTMQAGYEFLIPRAVGYSAGLINYFFRGEIDVAPDPSLPGTLLLKNLGSEQLDGTFKVYYDSANSRRFITEYATIIDSGASVSVSGFTPPTDPAQINPGEYIVVFQGQMGQEGQLTRDAVASRIFQLGGEGLITTAGGDARGFAPPGAGGAVTIETGFPLGTFPPASTALEVPVDEQLTLTPGVHSFSEILIGGTLRLSGDTILHSDGAVVLVGTIDGRDALSDGDGANLSIESLGPVFLGGTIDTSGMNAEAEGSPDIRLETKPGGSGGDVIIRTAATETFTVPTIITRGGDASLNDTRFPVLNFAGASGGDITIVTHAQPTPGVLALLFGGKRLPTDVADPLPEQVGAHDLPTRTTFARGLLTTGGYGGQLEIATDTDISQDGAQGGDGGNISIDCQLPVAIQFAETDLFIGGNVDVLLLYKTLVVFQAGQLPNPVNLVQRLGSLGGEGSFGGTRANGGNGGDGGRGGDITVPATCQLSPAPTTVTIPRRAPLFSEADPSKPFLFFSKKLPIVEAMDGASNRLYTLQAFGGGGGIPGGSGFSRGRCSGSNTACFLGTPSPCPGTQLCLPFAAGEPGIYGTLGADGSVSCATLGIPLALAEAPGLRCQ